MRLRLYFHAAALLALLASPAVAARSATTSSLEAALATVSADHIKSDIFFIASDELAGRDTPSNGQRVAARYIRARLERLGWAPGAPNGYFFEYPLRCPRIDEQATRLVFEREGKPSELTFGRDYFFAARKLTDGELAGGVAYCGRGADQEFGADVAGKWAIVLDEAQGALAVEKAASKAGAVGLIYVPGPRYEGKAYSERFSRDVTSTRNARVSWPAPSNDAKASKEKELAILYVTREAARKLCALDTLEALADGAPRPPLDGTLRDVRKLLGDNGMIQCENVCGFWRGSDPVLANEVIIVSAHYDHVGYNNTKEIHNGADDNGSGTTGLLALAEALVTRGSLRRSVMLMWVSGEEKGLWGSQAWTEHPWLPEGCKPVCDINIDMIGRNAPDYLLITPTSARKEYNGLVKLAEANCALEGFAKLGSCDSYWDRSDHRNFAVNLKIPVTFLFSDVHDDYHGPGDDPEKIDCDKIRRVVRLVLRMVEGLQTDTLAL